MRSQPHARVPGTTSAQHPRLKAHPPTSNTDSFAMPPPAFPNRPRPEAMDAITRGEAIPLLSRSSTITPPQTSSVANKPSSIRPRPRPSPTSATLRTPSQTQRSDIPSSLNRELFSKVKTSGEVIEISSDDEADTPISNGNGKATNAQPLRKVSSTKFKAKKGQPPPDDANIIDLSFDDDEPNIKQVGSSGTTSNNSKRGVVSSRSGRLPSTIALPFQSVKDIDKMLLTSSSKVPAKMSIDQPAGTHRSVRHENDSMCVDSLPASQVPSTLGAIDQTMDSGENEDTPNLQTKPATPPLNVMQTQNNRSSDSPNLVTSKGGKGKMKMQEVDPGGVSLRKYPENPGSAKPTVNRQGFNPIPVPQNHITPPSTPPKHKTPIATKSTPDLPKPRVVKQISSTSSSSPSSSGSPSTGTTSSREGSGGDGGIDMRSLDAALGVNNDAPVTPKKRTPQKTAISVKEQPISPQIPGSSVISFH